MGDHGGGHEGGHGDRHSEGYVGGHGGGHRVKGNHWSIVMIFSQVTDRSKNYL